MDLRPTVTSSSSDLTRSGFSCSLLASISFLNFCCSCCCRIFLSCLGSVCASDATAFSESAADLRGGERAWGTGRFSDDRTRPERRFEFVYLELTLSLFLLVLGVWTSEWLKARDSSNTLAGPAVEAVFLSRARLQNRAFSTDGCPSDRLVWPGSRGGGGFV